jgi:hypothetical protein
VQCRGKHVAGRIAPFRGRYDSRSRDRFFTDKPVTDLDGFTRAELLDAIAGAQMA